MTTARGLLRRLIFHGRLDPTLPAKRRGEPPVEARLEAARQRLKQTIPPPEEQASRPGAEQASRPGAEQASRPGAEQASRPGEEQASRPEQRTTPPPEISPGEESSARAR